MIYPLQAFVTEPLKPWLDNIVVSASLHIYVSQSSRGELITVEISATGSVRTIERMSPYPSDEPIYLAQRDPCP